MSYRKFKFISPGIFITEIDNSQLPAQPAQMGPALIGKTARGPALKPIQVNSFAEFIEIFGAPSPGGKGGDLWRDGSVTAPTYAAYAAQAWLRNNSPVTMVRLLGQTYKTATDAGKAGWKTTSIAPSTSYADNGGAFGLFICEGTTASFVTSSGDKDNATEPFTAANSTDGTLAAVWYLNNGAIALSGQTVTTGTTTAAYTASMAQFVRAVDSGPTFKVVVFDSSENVVINSSFNFNRTSPRFIRKVFNTNPTLTNSNITDSTALTNYWLGESFEGNVNCFKGTDDSGVVQGISGSAPSNCYGVIMRLADANGTVQGGDYRMGTTKSPGQQFAKTGWFISQDLTSNTGSYSAANMQKLFRLCARELGEETQRTIKISIKNLRASSDTDVDPYGSFSVVIREINDLDAAPRVLEQYNGCNLNPASNNYIAKKIGNRFESWDDTERKYRTLGDYRNASDYIYVEMNNSVDRGSTDASFLPFGVFGPPRYVGWAVSGTQATTYAYAAPHPSGSGSIFVQSGSQNPLSYPGGEGIGSLTGSATDGGVHQSSALVVNAKFKFPALRLLASSSEANTSDPLNAYFGVDTTYGTTRFEPSILDVIRTKADDIGSWEAATNYTENSWVFSLDNVRNQDVTGSDYAESYNSKAVYNENARVNGVSYTAHTGSSAADPPGPAKVGWENVISKTKGGSTAGWAQFTTLLHGASDGLNITEADPFNSTRALANETTTTIETSAPYNSINVALDSLRDPEVVEYNLLSAPGVINYNINRKMVEMCESRGDALAIIDLAGGYTPDTENTNSRADRVGSVQTVITNKEDNLEINSSYGCAYYPWVQIRDTINGAVLWAPPSVVALGAMGYSEANSHLWFAPAGFTRGGLSANRAGGVPVIGIEDRLTSRQRDELYETNINPIATFPAEGIVIFGQKTLQLNPSALDRINVRRLVIFLKKQISRFAATILFDQNVQTTWNRFKGKVEPFLADVKAGLGITEYKLILDETTTTPDLIDRNILYAKIFVKPARAIEYIAIDFIITDSGAAFGD